METQKVTPIEERSSIIQEVVDRMLYLSPQEQAKYKQALDVLHQLYDVDVQVKNGVRIYKLNQNLQ